MAEQATKWEQTSLLGSEAPAVTPRDGYPIHETSRGGCGGGPLILPEQAGIRNAGDGPRVYCMRERKLFDVARDIYDRVRDAARREGFKAPPPPEALTPGMLSVGARKALWIAGGGSRAKWAEPPTRTGYRDAERFGVLTGEDVIKEEKDDLGKILKRRKVRVYTVTDQGRRLLAIMQGTATMPRQSTPERYALECVIGGGAGLGGGAGSRITRGWIAADGTEGHGFPVLFGSKDEAHDALAKHRKRRIGSGASTYPEVIPERSVLEHVRSQRQEWATSTSRNAAKMLAEIDRALAALAGVP